MSSTLSTSCIRRYMGAHLRFIGWCKFREFNSDFPEELAGIMHPDEFQQSIANINDARYMTLNEKMVFFALFSCLVIGIIILIVGISLVWLRSSTERIVLISVGTVILTVVSVVCVSALIAVSRLVETRMKEATATESIKYSTRRPMPIRWRLDTHHYTVEYGGNRHHYAQYAVSTVITHKSSHFVEVIPFRTYSHDAYRFSCG